MFFQEQQASPTKTSDTSSRNYARVLSSKRLMSQKQPWPWPTEDFAEHSEHSNSKSHRIICHDLPIWIRWIDGFAGFAHLDHIIEIGDGFQNMFQITNQPCIAMFSNLSRREIIWNQRGAPVLDQIRVSQSMSWDLSDSLKSRMS